MRYSWTETKRLANIEKHGIDFAEAEAFDWAHASIRPDARADYGEHRFIAMGPIGTRIHVLVFTMRSGRIHIISLRKANIREVRHHDRT